MNGIIIVNKEKGFTSHDVVAKLRGILHTKKIGHTGTLDPDATGVLPVCIGKATKVCDLLTEKEKTYEAVIRFGLTTDTLDMTGTVLEEKPVHFTKDQLVETLAAFTGEIDQIPPMYSAIKVNGKKLYELARKGQVVERKPRKVTIYELELLSENLSENECTIRVRCSKGTYIRSLCQDIGEALGCGAAMKALVRTGVGRFQIGQALTLSQIEDACRCQNPESLLLTVDSVFDQYRSCQVSEKAMRFLKNGNLVDASFCDTGEKGPEDGENFRMYGFDGDFYAIYHYEKKDGMFHIVKMFHE
ncbi:MAG: tRNA pseudouridine(55) synthase TruB [Eubacterium sp.]|nr:tRNA pseudouridine(55) synthase TruB [Eubacterium sp.]